MNTYELMETAIIVVTAVSGILTIWKAVDLPDPAIYICIAITALGAVAVPKNGDSISIASVAT